VIATRSNKIKFCEYNIVNERLWRTVKYEEVYLKSYNSVNEARMQLMDFVEFYNHQRPHQSLKCKTPAEVYFAKKNCKLIARELAWWRLKDFDKF